MCCKYRLREQRLSPNTEQTDKPQITQMNEAKEFGRVATGNNSSQNINADRRAGPTNRALAKGSRIFQRPRRCSATCRQARLRSWHGMNGLFAERPKSAVARNVLADMDLRGIHAPITV